ncbi:MAG: hypothetical protein VKP70_03560 [Cyanobacteriota bacterium]|nr:hypothetical protein [Cyanobacteriota bacterium]
MGSRAFCTTVSFDSLTGEERDNHALGATRFGVDQVVVDPEAKRWMGMLLEGLAKQQQVTYLGVVGAPQPFQVATIRKPAAHPTPTNIEGAAQLTSQWARKTVPSDLAVNWVIWNEPEHTLRGTNSSTAATEMATIYRAYQRRLDNNTNDDGFGLASFMKASLRNTSDSPSQSFVGIVLKDLQRQPRPQIDYLTLNNYHGETSRLLQRLETDLASAGLDVPLVFTQFAPEVIGSKPVVAGTVDAGSHYLEALDRFVQSPNIGSACLSFWAGPDRKALLREEGGQFSPSVPFRALSMYQQLPLWRIPVKGMPSSSPFMIWAGADDDRLSVLIAPRPSDPAQGALPRTTDKTANKQARKLERKRLRREEKASRFSDGSAGSSPGSAESVQRERLQFQFTAHPNAPFTLRRLSDNATTVTAEPLRTDGVGRLAVDVASDEIVMLSTGQVQPLDPLLPQIRSNLYIHRRSPQGASLATAQAGLASVDALADGFVMALPSPQSIAHASATYPAGSLGSSLPLSWRSPLGSAGRTAGLACTAAVVQEFQGEKAVAATAWGHPAAVQRVLGSRAFRGGEPVPPRVSPWPTLDATGRMQLPVAKAPNSTELRLHIASSECKAGTQLQVRPLR